MSKTQPPQIKHYDWEQLSSSDKKSLSKKQPILVLGPRDISKQRIQQLTKKLVARRPLIWGCLRDQFIPGLENSPQFKSLPLNKLSQSLKKSKPAKNSIAILSYRHQYSQYLLKEISWSAVIAVYGSWHKAFHYRPEYYQINKQQLSHKLVSGFTNEAEAKDYYQTIKPNLPKVSAKQGEQYSTKELFAFSKQAARCSFDYTYQTGAVLAKNNHFLGAAHNRVLPYETYMLHQGASKEKHLAPPHDLNHFDTNHAEVELILQAQQQNWNLANTSLYINLLPCPICSRMLTRTPIKEIVYQHDHSQGYGYQLLTQAGKKLARIHQ